MRKTFLSLAVDIIFAIVFIDLFILLAGLAQIAVEGRTGYWSPFWKWQAEKVIRFIDN
jgi:hypothetical protein